MIKVGEMAPDFDWIDEMGIAKKLSSYQGKNVILAFYPADWSPVCGDQMSLYNEMRKFFERYNAIILGISVDSKWCHAAFKKHKNIHFSLLADFEPKGAISTLYKVYNQHTGEANRALYVIDENGTVVWSYLAEVGVNPGAEGIFDALEKLYN